MAANCCFAQTDTIFANTGPIACTVKEISTDAISYVYPGEDITNTVYKNAVTQIRFKSGRVQKFSEATSYKEVKDVKDFENVATTSLEADVKGLFRVGEVSAKAKGTTAYSNQETVKKRAYSKMKMGAAMQGGNVVFLTNQQSGGNTNGGRYGGANSSETNLSGVVYATHIPSFDEFKKLIGNKKTFTANEKSSLWSSASEVETIPATNVLNVKSVENESGAIYITGTLEKNANQTRFRVVNFTKDSFTVYFEDKSTAFNYKFKL